MHVQVSTPLTDHLFGFLTTSVCLSACCGRAAPRTCEENLILQLPIKECKIKKSADAGAVRDTLPDMLDRWAHGTMRHVAPAASEYKCLLPGQPGILFWLLINVAPKRRSLFFCFLIALMLDVWMHALNLIQQECSERQCKCS